MIARIDLDIFARRRDAATGEKALVRLFIDQHIVLGAAACRTAENLRRATILVPEGPEQVLGVGRKGKVTIGALHGLGQHRSGGQVLDIDAVDLGTLLIDRIGAEAMVGAVVAITDLVIGLALARRIRIKHDLLALVRAARAARKDRLFSAFFVTRIIVPGAVRGGDRAVIFFDAALHLLEHLGLKGLGRGEHGFGVGVLFGQVRLDVGLNQAGIAQHLLPVIVFHPRIVINPNPALLLNTQGNFQGNGRCRASGVHGRGLGLGGRNRWDQRGQCKGQGTCFDHEITPVHVAVLCVRGGRISPSPPLEGERVGRGGCSSTPFCATFPERQKSSGSLSAFAGKTEGRNKAPYVPSGHFPQRGKIYRYLIFPLWGKYRRSRGRGS